VEEQNEINKYMKINKKVTASFVSISRHNKLASGNTPNHTLYIQYITRRTHSSTTKGGHGTIFKKF